MALQHLRSSTAHKRPIPTVMSAGQIAINTNEASPAVFFKDSNGDLVKVGPVHIGEDAPNSSPASVAATALVTGTVYQILTVGTSDFTSVGASANTVGTIFTATGTTTGTGTVSGQQGVEKGEMWLDTTGGIYVLKIYDGSAWRSESGTFVDSAGDTMTGALGVVAGSASAPGVFFSGDTNTGLLAPAADSVAITTGGTQRIVVDSAGRLGLGTASPTQKVHIQDSSGPLITFDDGTTQFGSLGSYNRLTGSGAVDTFLVSSANSKPLVLRAPTGQTVSFDIASSEAIRIDSSGRLLVGTTTPGSGAADNFTIADSSNAGLTIRSGSTSTGSIYFSDGTTDPVQYDGQISYNQNSRFMQFATAQTERMRIDSSGNVGIGNSSPSSYNSDGRNLVVGSGSGGQGLSIASGTSSYGTIYFADGTSGDALYRGSVLYNHASDFMRFDTAASERMRINSAGNVGVGTTSINNKFVIASSGSTPAYFHSVNASTGTSGNDGIVMGMGDATNAYFWNYESGSIVFATNALERMRLDSSGRLGIGTTAPQASLTIGDVNSSVEDIVVHTSNNGNARLRFREGGTQSSGFNEYSFGMDGSANAITFETQGQGEVVRIDTLGRVGIGESSPAANLEITPGTGAGTLLLNNASGSTTDGALNIEVNSGGVIYESRKTGGLAHIWYATGAERMRIDSSGKLGVGFSSPARALSVHATGTDSVTGYLQSGVANVYLQLGNSVNGNGYIGYQSTSLTFYTNNNLRMLINDSGNMGLGTSSPTSLLHLAGPNPRIIFEDTARTNAFGKIFSSGGSLYLQQRDNSSHGSIVFRTENSTAAVERMRVDSAGRLLVNRSSSASNGALAQFSSSVGPHISVNNTSTAGTFMLFQNSTTGDSTSDGLYVGMDASKGYFWNYESAGLIFGNNGATVGQFIGTKLNVPGVYSGTTTGGGPVYVESDGDLLRYTSSLKYKTDVETLEDARADAILNCRPVWYRSKCENDIKTEGAEKSDWGWYGFIAEEVAEIEPRLVNWATKDSVEQEDKTTLSVERDPADYEAEGVRYDNFVPLMLNLIKRQKAQIETLEQRLSDAGIA